MKIIANSPAILGFAVIEATWLRFLFLYYKEIAAVLALLSVGLLLYKFYRIHPRLILS